MGKTSPFSKKINLKRFTRVKSKTPGSLPLPNFRARRSPSLYPPIRPLRHTIFPISKAYLVTTLVSHTWNYALPDLSLGSYAKMVSGVFMQKGSLTKILNLFKGLRELPSLVSASQASYKKIEPSFPHLEAPKAFLWSGNLALLNFNLAEPSGKQRSRRKVLPRLRLFRLKKLKFLSLKKSPRPYYHLRKGGPRKKVAPRLRFRPKRRTRTLSRLLKRASVYKVSPIRLVKLRLATGGKALWLNQGGPKVSLPRQKSLLVWNLLYQQPLLNYSLKYCRLSRRVRKILKNKYKYSKYYFVIAPYKRRLFTLQLWKYILKFHDERTFLLKFESFLKNIANPDGGTLLWSLFYTQQRLALRKLLGR